MMHGTFVIQKIPFLRTLCGKVTKSKVTVWGGVCVMAIRRVVSQSHGTLLHQPGGSVFHFLRVGSQPLGQLMRGEVVRAVCIVRAVTVAQQIRQHICRRVFSPVAQ